MVETWLTGANLRVDDPGIEFMLTTVDNPIDPFTRFAEWFAFDTTRGYHSAGLLARCVWSSDELSDADQHQAVQLAIDEIVRENVSGMHRKVQRSDFVDGELKK